MAKEMEQPKSKSLRNDREALNPLPHVEPLISAIPNDWAPILREAAERLGIVGTHPDLLRALTVAAKIAPSPIPILLVGETGTGKEQLAKFIHALSHRCQETFVAVNCASVPQQLADSFFFGHEKGAFTGACHRSLGKFAEADGGTLFLDEIGELPTETQAKLLRVCEDGKLPVVGGSTKLVNVRLITATSVDLVSAIHAGKFKPDLYFRLAASEIRLPPLRQRLCDLPALVGKFLERLNQANPRKISKQHLSRNAMQRLLDHHWPGNIRELSNLIQNSYCLSDGEVIEESDLLFCEFSKQAAPPTKLPEPYVGFDMEIFLSDARVRLIERALEIAEGHPTAAARLLNCTAQNVSRFKLNRSKLG